MTSCMRTLVLTAILAMAGCNVVPPLDCLTGAARPGCQRDSNGEYGYLYRSMLTPNGRYDLNGNPVQQSPKSQTTCSKTGDTTVCTTITY